MILQARSEYRVKYANYVRNIKNAIPKIFGQTRVGEIPGNRLTTEDIMSWKSSTGVKWARDHLWSMVDEDGDDQHDTYMSRIVNEVFKPERCTTNNCAFTVAIIDLIFDTKVHTTTLTGEMIADRMNKLSDKEVFKLIFLLAHNFMILIFTFKIK